jgi:hypothetical protein
MPQELLYAPTVKQAKSVSATTTRQEVLYTTTVKQVLFSATTLELEVFSPSNYRQPPLQGSAHWEHILPAIHAKIYTEQTFRQNQIVCIHLQFWSEAVQPIGLQKIESPTSRFVVAACWKNMRLVRVITAIL